jgi:hypothetical protein
MSPPAERLLMAIQTSAEPFVSGRREYDMCKNQEEE